MRIFLNLDTGAIKCTSMSLSLYSGRIDDITKKAVVPCDCSKTNLINIVYMFHISLIENYLGVSDVAQFLLIRFEQNMIDDSRQIHHSNFVPTKAPVFLLSQSIRFQMDMRTRWCSSASVSKPHIIASVRQNIRCNLKGHYQPSPSPPNQCSERFRLTQRIVRTQIDIAI